MPNRYDEDDAGRPKGETVPVQGEKQERVPRAPHERDESATSQENENPSARRIGEIAHDDVQEGQPDTDKGPVLDKTYHELRKDEDPPSRK